MGRLDVIPEIYNVQILSILIGCVYMRIHVCLQNFCFALGPLGRIFYNNYRNMHSECKQWHEYLVFEIDKIFG